MKGLQSQTTTEGCIVMSNRAILWGLLKMCYLMGMVENVLSLGRKRTSKGKGQKLHV